MGIFCLGLKLCFCFLYPSKLKCLYGYTHTKNENSDTSNLARDKAEIFVVCVNLLCLVQQILRLKVFASFELQYNCLIYILETL